MYMIQIEESKVNKLSDHIEQGLRHLGKAMQCVDEWMEEGSMHHREGHEMPHPEHVGRYGGGHMDGRYPIYRGGMGYRDDEDWDDDEYAERRRRSRRTGRYM